MQRTRSGFTIVELLIVVVVIAILAAISLVAYNGIQSRARTSSLKSDLNAISKKLAVLRTQDGLENYPATLAAANITTNGANTLQYTVDNVSAVKTYCVTITPTNSSVGSFFVTNDGSVQSGACAGHSTGPDPTLVGWWKLNGDTTDSSGSGYDGSPSNITATAGQGGVANTAYSFNGTSSTIALPGATNSMNSFTSMTMSGWFNPTVMQNERSILRKDYTLSLSTFGGDVRYLVGTNGGTTGWTGGNDKPCGCAVNTWHFAVATWDGISERYYVNGSLIATVNVSGTIVTNSSPLAISPSGTYFSGKLDDIRLYSRALSASDISALYAAGAQ